jgi:hypothetical protein
LVFSTYLDKVKGLVYGGLGVERESGIDLGGDLSGDNLQNLLSKLHQQVVQRGVHLCVYVLAMLLAVRNSGIDQLRVLGLLRGSEDERGVCGRILRLVLVDGRKVTGVADDGLVGTVR